MKEFLFSPRIDQLPIVLEFARLEAAKNGFSHSEVQRIELVMEEVFVNILQHGKTTEQIKVRIDPFAPWKGMKISIHDKGIPYAPNKITMDSGDGAGVRLIFNLTDHVAYRYYCGFNELTLIYFAKNSFGLLNFN